MKIVTICDHLPQEYLAERQKKWMDPSDEGKYTIISELCRDCFLTAGSAHYDLLDSPVSFWDGRPTQTVREVAKEVMDEA